MVHGGKSCVFRASGRPSTSTKVTAALRRRSDVAGDPGGPPLLEGYRSYGPRLPVFLALLGHRGEGVRENEVGNFLALLNSLFLIPRPVDAEVNTTLAV